MTEFDRQSRCQSVGGRWWFYTSTAGEKVFVKEVNATLDGLARSERSVRMAEIRYMMRRAELGQLVSGEVASIDKARELYELRWEFSPQPTEPRPLLMRMYLGEPASDLQVLAGLKFALKQVEENVSKTWQTQQNDIRIAEFRLEDSRGRFGSD